MKKAPTHSRIDAYTFILLMIQFDKSEVIDIFCLDKITSLSLNHQVDTIHILYKLRPTHHIPYSNNVSNNPA